MSDAEAEACGSSNEEGVNAMLYNRGVELQFTRKIKMEFLEIYERMVADIRESNFKPIEEISQREKINISKIGNSLQNLRTTLNKVLTNKFENFWSTQSMDVNLALLEEAKKMSRNSKIPEWRPSGKSVSEQTLPLRIKILKQKKAFLLEQWEFQKKKLDTVEKQVSENRKKFQSIAIRREELLYRIDDKLEKLEEIKRDITKSQLDILDAKCKK